MEVAGSIQNSAQRLWKQCLFDAFGEESRKRLKYHLILEQSSIAILQHLSIHFQFLKVTGLIRAYPLDEGAAPKIDDTSERLIYLCQNTPSAIQMIGGHLLHPPRGVKISVFVMPFLDGLAELMLEEMGVYGIASLFPFPVPLFPIDTHVLSTGADHASYDFCTHNDTRCVPRLALGLLSLEKTLHCTFTPVVCIGAAAQDTFVLMNRLRDQRDDRARSGAGEGNDDDAADDRPHRECRLVIFDRKVDMVPLFCTQLVYPGMVQETLGLKGVECELKPPEGEKVKVLLSSLRDSVYEQIRDENFAKVTAVLGKIVKELGDVYKLRESDDLQQLKDFVRNHMGDATERHRQVGQHLAVAERVVSLNSNDATTEVLEAEHGIVSGIGFQDGVNLMEELICRPQSPNDALRLLILALLTKPKIDQATYSKWKRMYMDAFGDAHIVTFSMVDQLLSDCLSAAEFHQARKRYSCVPSDDRTQVFYGLQPLSTQLIADCCRARGESDLSPVQGDLSKVRMSFERPLASQPRHRQEARGLPTTFELDASPNPDPKLSRVSSQADERNESGEKAEEKAAQRRQQRRKPKPLQHSVEYVVCFVGGTTFSELTHLRSVLAQHGLRTSSDNTLVITSGMLCSHGMASYLRQVN